MKINEPLPTDPTILIGQQGYEGALVRLGILSPKYVISFFEHRRNRYRLVAQILRALAILARETLSGRKSSLVISSLEADEALALVWLGIRWFRLRAEIWILEINDREKLFEPIEASEVSLPRRTKLVLGLLAKYNSSSVCYVRNDVGQPSYMLNLPVDRRVSLPVLDTFDETLTTCARLFILLEPERSCIVIERTKWLRKMEDVVAEARRHFPDIKILQKAHPYQACWALDVPESELLPQEVNIFDLLQSDDWVVGTFGNVIDISPQICRTTSIFHSVAKPEAPQNIYQRIKWAGADTK